MSTCERLAAYVARASWEEISPEAKGKLRQHVLDTLGCAAGALGCEALKAIAPEPYELSGSGPCSLIGGGSTTPERAAFYNGALVRFLDFTDTFLAQGETCYPADNFAGIMAAAELAGASGREFLTALAVAYHVQCRLTASEALITRKGFAQTMPLAISLACGMSRVLGLSAEKTAHAIALCAVNGLSLGGARTGEPVSQWEGLASAGTALQCLHNVRLAQKGITGPLQVFEGPAGLYDTLGKEFSIDWDRENYDGILACNIKRYDADLHAQSAIEAILELQRENDIAAADVHGIQVDIFKAAYDALGAGKYNDPKTVRTEKDARRSLPYLLSVAILDSEVLPGQFATDRIKRHDVQSLLPQVSTWLSLAYTHEYPDSLRCKVRVGLKDGRIFEIERADYSGSFRRPMPVEELLEKFKNLSRNAAPEPVVQRLIEAIAKVEQRAITELMAALRNLNHERPAEFATASSARA